MSLRQVRASRGCVAAVGGQRVTERASAVTVSALPAPSLTLSALLSTIYLPLVIFILSVVLEFYLKMSNVSFKPLCGNHVPLLCVCATVLSD